MNLPRLIGMIHLGPLPGAPGFSGSLDEVVRRALEDAAILTEAGFGALLIENFGDAPFFPDDVPPITVAAMTRVGSELRSVTDAVLGVNVLRNDGLAAVAIATAIGADLVRVNVLSGTMFTDQGLIDGKAAEIARSRHELAPHLQILADVFVKHSVAPPGLTIAQAARDTWERGGASALVVSGAGTGFQIDLSDLMEVREAVPDAPVVIGSGASPLAIARYTGLADAVIVGTTLKVGEVPTAPLDPGRVRAFVESAAEAGFLD